MIVSYAAHHRAPVLDLLERSLLPEDAMEATAILDLLTGTTGPDDRAEPAASPQALGRAPSYTRSDKKVPFLTESPGARRVGFVALDNGDVIGVMLASVGHRDTEVGHLDLLVVDPAQRRNGRARALLSTLETEFRERGLKSIEVAGNPPDHAWPGVDVRYTPAICALTSLGYTHERTAWNMTADLVAGSPALRDTVSAEARLAGAGVIVRKAVPDDLPVLLAVVAREWGAAWATEVQRALTGHGGCHLALRDGTPIAFAAWGACRPSWFGPMGTLPTATGLGIGGVLLRRCLREQSDLGHTEAQIGWVGPVPFYSLAAGAQIERVFFLFTKPLLP